MQEWLSNTRRVKFSDDGRTPQGQWTISPSTGSLGVVTGPGGALLTLDYTNSQVKILEPDDFSAIGLVVHDIFPWRAPASGGYPFVIGGVGFGTLANTSVTIGGLPATLTAVSARRIHGVVPAEVAPTTDLVDVVVTVDMESDTLPEAFRYLLGPGLEPGAWEGLPNMPATVGEVAGGVIDGVLYIVGEGSSNTFAYDTLGRFWLPSVATRPFVGHHHAAGGHRREAVPLSAVWTAPRRARSRSTIRSSTAGARAPT